ncbi:Uncharacterised protein [Neisseria meningitidis]|nr:Uncharacterised protein [Neisseria meningitidis]
MKPGFFGHIFLTVLSIAYPALFASGGLQPIVL